MCRPLPVLLALAVLLSIAVVGCGSADDGSSASVENAVGQGNVAETPSTELEARAQRLREELARLERQQARRAVAAEDAAPASGAEAGSAASGTGGRSVTEAGAGAIFSPAARQSFERLAARLPGQVGIAASGSGLGQPVESLGPLQSGVAWSTSKVPVAMAAIAAGVADDGDLRAATTASDNAAATSLWNALGGGARAASAADAQLRAAGDDATAIESRTLRAGYTPFGQTSWTLADQTRFTAGMACTAAGGEVLGLMRGTIAEHRWGLGATGLPFQLKGGWGPGSQPGADGGYLDRQLGVLTLDGTPLAVTLATLPADGSHESGTAQLTELARWVAANADVAGLPRQPAC